ncbi:transmembrane protein, putative [Bodo saltans]|uniref:Transmembrane protein, putative n=1 Tax=Bodo saltans TaxID=75058 RepID=A0A0S4KIY3_BODSA|nr:transmembrane protein, putative [Bodo saltans]|eukprot:CUI14490.1 transmembrane protein, putative [Bodo saltans]
MLFRIKNVVYSGGETINYGGYLGPNASYKIPNAATTWASSSNMGVNGLYSLLFQSPMTKTSALSPSASPSTSVPSAILSQSTTGPTSASPSASSSTSVLSAILSQSTTASALPSLSRTLRGTETDHTTSPSQVASSTVTRSRAVSDSFNTKSLTQSLSSASNTIRRSFSIFTTTASSVSLGVATLSLQCFALNDTILLWFIPLRRTDDVVVLLFDESYAQASTDSGLQVSTVFASSQPIPRNVIRTFPFLAFNISFESRLTTAAVQRVIGDVTLGFGNTQRINATVHTTDTAAWHTIVLHPPSSGWIGATVPLLSPQTLRIAITVVCDNSVVLLVQISVPVPAVSRELTALVDAAGSIAQISSVVAGGAAWGSSLARVMTVHQIVLCDADAAVSGGVIDLELIICDSSSQDRSLAVARSAIASNVVLVAAVAVVLLLLAAVWARIMRTSLIRGTRAFCLPSSLLPVLTTVVPSTTASSVLLLARVSTSACVGVDIVLALIGLAIAALPCCSFLLLCVAKEFGGAWRCEPRTERRKQQSMHASILGSSKLLSGRISTFLRKACTRTHDWKSADGTRMRGLCCLSTGTCVTVRSILVRWSQCLASRQ